MSRVEPVDPRLRLVIVQWPEDMSRGMMTTFCAEHGISRKTFYENRKRALEDPHPATSNEGTPPRGQTTWAVFGRPSPARFPLPSARLQEL